MSKGLLHGQINNNAIHSRKQGSSVKTYDYGEHLQKAALNRPPKGTKF